MTNRRRYLQQRLSSHLTDAGDTLPLELIAGELLEATVDSEIPTRRYSGAQLTWYARRVDEARARLDTDYASRQSLMALARGVGMSAFHFARVFRELTGVPPHRYLVTRRLRAAADRLRDGDSVTDTCYAVGFNSLGHFIEMFRRAYGVSPSRFAAAKTIRSAGL